MALGNYDNNEKNRYNPVYYSSYNSGNKDGIDPSAISYNFQSRMLKISISPLKMNQGDKVSYDHENAASIWLQHTKARMLYDEILKVLKGEISNGGVTSGTDGLIRFSDGKELGINAYCLIISKINPDTGETISSYTYQFKDKHYYAVENYNPNDSQHKKCYHNDLEINLLLDTLKSYYEAMAGGTAYSVLDAFRFNIDTNNTKMDLIMSKLGVEYKSGMTSRQSALSGHRSYFDNSTAAATETRTMRTATMEELE